MRVPRSSHAWSPLTIYIRVSLNLARFVGLDIHTRTHWNTLSRIADQIRIKNALDKEVNLWSQDWFADLA